MQIHSQSQFPVIWRGLLFSLRVSILALPKKQIQPEETLIIERTTVPSSQCSFTIPAGEPFSFLQAERPHALIALTLTTSLCMTIHRVPERNGVVRTSLFTQRVKTPLPHEPI